MARAEVTVRLADLPEVQAAVAALRDENDRMREALTLIHEGLSGGCAAGLSPAVALGLESIARHALRVPEEVR